MDMRLTRAALLAVTALSCAGAFAADAKSSLSSSDRKFMEKAAAGGMAEVQLGQLAKQRGASEEVKSFGAQMSRDHAKANDELRVIASSKGVTLPSSLDRDAQKEMGKLSRLKGDEFDRAYMDHMVKDHRQDVKEFQKASKDARDPEVKGFAARTLTVIEGHLQVAQRADDAIKAKPAAPSPQKDAK